MLRLFLLEINVSKKTSLFPFHCQIYPHTKIVTIFLSKITANADIRLVYTSDGVGVVIRNVKRYERVKIESTES